MHFTKTTPELEHFIDRAHLIKDLGGDDAYSYHYVEPSPGENSLLDDAEARTRLLEARATVVREFEKSTQDWIKESLAPSSSKGKAAEEAQDQEDHPARLLSLQEKRTELITRLRSGYWQLDPYLRAKTLYDRLGMIGKGGEIHFFHSGSSSEAGAGNEVTSQDNQKKGNTTTTNAHPSSTSKSATNASAAAATPSYGHRDHDLD